MFEKYSTKLDGAAPKRDYPKDYAAHMRPTRSRRFSWLDESSDFDEEEEEEEEEDDWLEGADDALGAEDEELARMITPP